MTLVEGKESMVKGEASSSSNNQTPKSLKPKPQIAKKPVGDGVATTTKLDDTPPVQGKKKIVKKKIVVKRRIVKKKKEGVQNVDSGDMKQKNVLGGEQSEINHENLIESKKVTESNDKVESQNLNKEESKQKEVMGGDQSKNNDGNLKKRKKAVVVRKKIGNDNGKEGSQAVNNTEELKQKNLNNLVESKKSLENVKTNEQNNEKNRDHLGGSQDKRRKQNIEFKNEQSFKKEGNNSQKKIKKVGGVILFCSGTTKPDCFRYHVMGVKTSRKDLVLSIKPGLILFLFDFDLKVLYGIYKATSSGGTNLEPAAFNSRFPFQVRFEIYRDCHPLPESVFRRAIEENYGGKDKFDPELTFQQVNKLMELFKPAEVKHHVPLIYPPQAVNVERVSAQHTPLIYPPQDANVERVKAKERETEYLAPHHREPSGREPYTYNESTRYDLRLDGKNEPLAHRHTPSAQRKTSPDQLFLSEKEYRTYGLRRERRNVTLPTSHIAPTSKLESSAQEHQLARPDSTYGFAEKHYSTSYSHSTRQEPSSSGLDVSACTASILDPDYRTYGLLRERREVTPPKRRISPTLKLDSRAQEHRYIHPGGTYSDNEKQYTTSYSHFARQELGSSSTASMVESDYRTYGLHRERRNVSPPKSHIASSLEHESRSNQYPVSNNHFAKQELGSSCSNINASTASIVDSYLKVPYYGSSRNPYQPSSRLEREEAALGSSSLGILETTYQSETSHLPRRDMYPSQTKHYLTEASYAGRRENERGVNISAGSLHSSNALSGYNQQHTSRGPGREMSKETVSDLYSFAGSSHQYP